MIKLDGAFGEAGGALVRVALALSTLTGQEFTVKNIRAGRSKPGLKAQHLHAIKALKEICNAETNEIDIGSTELEFTPGKVKAGVYNIDIGTAGSISLLLQALIIPCMFAPGKVTLNVKGGTCGKWQAPVEYLQNVFAPYVKKFVNKFEIKVVKRGYFPVGGGEVKVEIWPEVSSDDPAVIELFCNALAKFELEEAGELQQVRGIVNVSSDLQEKEIAERIKMAAEVSLKELEVPISIRVEYSKTLSTGGEIVLWAVFGEDADNFMGSDCLVEKGKSSEAIGKEAAENLCKEVGAGFGIDYYLADQIMPLMGLLPGSRITTRKVSKHCLTNIYVVEKFLPVGFKIGKHKIIVEQKDL
jgi:RNA 3'-phosphate cyclase